MSNFFADDISFFLVACGSTYSKYSKFFELFKILQWACKSEILFNLDASQQSKDSFFHTTITLTIVTSLH